MCEKVLEKVTKKLSLGPSMPPRRSSIWDLPAHQCCPVVGTCLDVNELKRVKNRFSKQL